MKENSAVRMIVTLVVIAVIVAGIMSVVNSITAPIIAENAEKELNAALAEVIDADTFDKKRKKMVMHFMPHLKTARMQVCA